MSPNGEIGNACRESLVGKLTRSALYIHSTCRQALPRELRLLMLKAEVRLAEEDEPIFGANILKIARDGSSVSFLRYPDFDTDPHPALSWSTHVPLDRRKSITCRHYNTGRPGQNPPVLHRKEEMLLGSYPGFIEFRRLTRDEEKAGLLTRTPGFRRQWQERLKEAGYQIWGHRLRKR